MTYKRELSIHKTVRYTVGGGIPLDEVHVRVFTLVDVIS